MADENNTGAGEFMSITMGADGKPVIEKGTQDGLSTDDIEAPEVVDDEGTEGGAADADVSDDDAGDDDTATDAEDGDDDGDDEEGSDEDLGEFDPEDVTAWDAKYTKEDGNLNEEVLTAEWDGNDGSLNEETYKYLASKGISREFAKQVEAALKTQRDGAAEDTGKKVAEQDLELMTVAGGPDKLKEALEWGKGGGYSEDARKAFSELMATDNLDAKRDAVELLMARYEKSKGKPKTPKRDATKQGGKPSRKTIQPFKSREDYYAALEAAGDNGEAIKGINRRWLHSAARTG